MRKIVFLTGTRADFGKLKSLIKITFNSKQFEVHIFATGMHMNPKYGRTVDEIIKSGFKNIFMYYNHFDYDSMDMILAKTIEGFSHYVNDIKPDLIVVHGDRLEALAGAIVGSLNNIFTAHIEGGEVSGTVDEILRHAVSKLSHIHFVSNELAQKRLIQMGEDPNSVFIIGSPDVDIMLSKRLPKFSFVKKHYEIKFSKYAIAIFHPVVTELDNIKSQIKNFVDALIKSNLNYIVIYPNNDAGAEFIFSEYERIKNNSKFRYLPSLRFEYFLVLLKNAKFMIGNSSAGVREAPYYKIPSINIGTRQNRRTMSSSIINCGYEKREILKAIKKANIVKIKKTYDNYGDGKSDKKFLHVLKKGLIWKVNKQKIFLDI